jgi:hypothetical protein
MIIRFSQALLCLFLLTSCVTTRFESQAWPDAAPARSHFEAIYAADRDNREVQTLEDYLLWIVRYYEGWELYGRGWKHVTEDVLTGVEDPQTSRELAGKMADLGKAIAGEWAKNSDARRIRNQQLSVWGNALLEAIERGEQLEMIAQISQDVEYLLSRQVAQSDITADRYYAQDPHDVFR